MKNWVAMVACACACVSGQGAMAGALTPGPGNSTSESFFAQLTQEWENAVQAGDIGKLGLIEDDEWRSVGPGTLVSDKKQDLAGVGSGAVKHVVADLGPIDVKMLNDDVAVVQGTFTDKSSAGPENVAARKMYTYMDVWVKRGDHWSVIRSQCDRVK